MANEVGNIGSGAATGAGLGTMFLPGIGTAVGAGAGGLIGIIKSILDSQNERKDRIAQATTTRYSPWTKLQAADVRHSNGFGDVLAGLASGAQLGQGIQKGAADNQLTQAIAAKLGSSPGQAGQQQGSAPIMTQDESGKGGAPIIPAQASGQAEPGLQDLLGGQDPDQMMKILRLAQSGRKNYGSMA